MKAKNKNIQQVLLIFILAVINFTANGQVSVYDCTVPLNVQSTDINPSPTFLFEAPCIDFQEVVNFNHPTGANKDFKASQQITVAKNFRVGNDGSSQFRLRIEESKLDVVAFDITSLSGIPKFDKFELGIEIPVSVQYGIDQFLFDEMSTGALNPYMDWDIEVEATFTHSTSGTTIKKHGFYFEDFQRIVYDNTVTHTSFGDPIFGGDGLISHDGYKEWGGRWDPVATSHPFRIRFAPPELGEWDCSIKLIVDEGAEVFLYDSFRFNVIPSDNKGFVEVGDNNRFFKRGDETFIPIGPNLSWPATEERLEPADYALLGNNNEKYRYGTAPLKSFLNFEKRIIELAGSGANNFRYIMSPWAGDIEFEKIGNYTDRLNIAWEMDRMISLSNSLDLNIDFNMLLQYNLEYGPYGIRPWDWADGTEYVKEVLVDSILVLGEYIPIYDIVPNSTDVNDLIPYCYATLSGVDVPEDFLSNADAIKYYKQRLRYIIARWGYATNITNWELFSEIDGIGKGNFRGNPYRGELASILIDEFPVEFVVESTAPEVQQMVENWHQTMSSYIKTNLDDPHIVSASYAGHIRPNDQTYSLSTIDISSENLYNHSRVLDFAHSVSNPDEIDYEFYSGSLSRIDSIAGSLKPIIFSEQGMQGGVFKCDNGLEFRRNLWMNTFLGVAMANDWNAWLTPEYWNEYGKVASFIAGTHFDGGNWASGVNFNGWDQMESNDLRADMTYLRSNTGLDALGVISNRTNNFRTQFTGPITLGGVICDDDPNGDIWPNNKDIYGNFTSISKNANTLKVRMAAGDFKITYYDTETNALLHTQLETNLLASTGMKLEYPTMALGHPFIAFKIEPMPKSYSSENEELEELESIGVTLYPNPTEGRTELLIRDFDPNNPTYKVEIFDLMGKRIRSVEVLGNSTPLELRDQPSGVYLVQFMDGEKKITLRLVKN